MPAQSSLVRAPGLIALALIAFALAAPRVGAVPVHGIVSLPRPPAAAPAPAAERVRRDHYWNVWAELLDPVAARVPTEREVSVVLTGDANPRSRGCSYRIEGGDLFPRTLVAQANTRISLENRDGTAHRVYSDTLPGLTALRTAPGRAREVAVPDAGRWELRDREYPQLVGHLVSIPDLAACATVTPRGEWRFSDVAAGTYVLKVYRAGQEAHAAPLTVAAGTREVVVEPILLTGN